MPEMDTQFFKTKKEIKKFLDSLSFPNYKIAYTIEDDLSVNIHTDLLIYGKELTHIPIKINSVQGNIDVSNNQLTTLIGCPDYIPGKLIARNNQLENLEGCPKSIGEDIILSDNKLKNLKGIPILCSGFLNCQNNEISSLEYLPLVIRQALNLSNNHLTKLDMPRCKVGGMIDFSDNPLTSIEGFDFLNINLNPFDSTFRHTNTYSVIEYFESSYDKNGVLRLKGEEIEKILNIIKLKEKLLKNLGSKSKLSKHKI